MEYQAYPKWVTTASGDKFIVPDAATEAAVLAGTAEIPVFPVGDSTTHHPIVPSVVTAEQIAAAKAAQGSTKKGAKVTAVKEG